MEEPMIYQNYHKHTMYSNARVPDSVATYEQYAIKAKEYGHSILSSVEHGWQGRYIEVFEIAQKHNLVFLFGTEAYFVFDRKTKDATNAHIVILAKNENGRKAINKAISTANETGFYYQPRLDYELVMDLPSEDVWITTACVGGILKYTQDRWVKIIEKEPDLGICFDFIEEPYEFLIREFQNKFKENFMLEVQCHNTPAQKTSNLILKSMAKKYNASLIAGVDSHYVDESKAWERDEYLNSRGIRYEEESGWFMDYPSGETLFKRFLDQDVLTEKEIIEAIEKTNIFLNVLKYDSPVFEKTIKMPILPMYKNLTQAERDKVFTDLVWEKWQEEKQKLPQEKYSEYEEEIKREIQTVIDVKHSDYFLLDYAVIQNGIKNGGVLTATSRGSAPSFYLNKLLGITSIDAMASPIHLYPERFLSKTRILTSGSLADIDLNVASAAPFAKAQTDLLGLGHSYPVIAFGTYKIKSAWKLFAKAQNISFDISNAVAGQIDKYLEDLNNAEEQEKEDIRIEDYIDLEYQQIFETSKVYMNIVASVSIHPCAYLVTNLDIPSEIGTIQVNENLCCIMDGGWAEDYKFLKNDLLTVSVVDFIKKTYDRIGIPQHESQELIDICKTDHPCWDIYKNAWTVGINQCEQPSSKHKVATYKPRNISELSAFVAAIRPGFKSMYGRFEKREKFSYGIPTIDNLIQTKEFPQSFMLYQEQAMRLLNYSGIPMDETYDIIKAIAKKRPDKILKYKESFIKGISDKIKTEQNSVTEEDAIQIAEDIWQIIDDSQKYSFNACVIGDTMIERPGQKNNAYQPTIAELYNLKNSAETSLNHKHLQQKIKKYGYGKSLSLNADGRVRINKIIDIMYSGFKPVYEINTISGKKIVCTKEHKFPTKNGEKKLEQLNLGDALYCKGIEVFEDEIVSIEFIGEDHVYDITMAAPNHNFVLKNGLIVSNSHSLSVALDSLYGAYLKSVYPLEFYETYLRVMESTNKKNKMISAQQEAIEAYKINFPPMRFGQDNRQVVLQKETNSIMSSIQSLKSFSRRVGYALYTMKDIEFKSFTDVLYHIKEKTPINTGQLDTLIVLNYFEQFGGNKKLLEIARAFSELYTQDKQIRDLNVKQIQAANIPENLVLENSNRFEEKTNYWFYVFDKKDYIKVQGEIIGEISGLKFFQRKVDNGWEVRETHSSLLLLISRTKNKKKDIEIFLSDESSIKKFKNKIRGHILRFPNNPYSTSTMEELSYFEKKYYDVDIFELLTSYECSLPDELLPVLEQVNKEKETVGSISSTYPLIPKRYCYVEEIDIKYKPRINLYALKTGKHIEVRIPINVFKKNKIKAGDFISAEKFEKTQMWNPPNENGDFIAKKGVFEWSLLEYYIVPVEKMEKIISQKNGGKND